MRSDLILIRISSDERVAFEACAKSDGKKLSTWGRDMLRGCAGLDREIKAVSEKPKTSHAPKPAKEEPKKPKESLSVPTVQRLEKEFSPAVDPSRCEGGFHCPMSAVIEKKGKWLCEHHSK